MWTGFVRGVPDGSGPGEDGQTPVPSLVTRGRRLSSLAWRTINRKDRGTSLVLRNEAPHMSTDLSKDTKYRTHGSDLNDGRAQHVPPGRGPRPTPPLPRDSGTETSKGSPLVRNHPWTVSTTEG